MLATQDQATSPPQLVSQAADNQLPGLDSVKAELTSKRRGRQVENDEYGAFVRRILRANGGRIGDGDVEAQALMLDLAEEIDTAAAEAVKGLRSYGYSWAEIGARLGITRQAAQSNIVTEGHKPVGTCWLLLGERVEI